MKIVKKYQTDDGEMFDDQGSAAQHELEMSAREQIKSIVLPAYNADRAESVIRSIINNAHAVRDALNAYIRRLPNPRKSGKGKKNDNENNGNNGNNGTREKHFRESLI